MRGSGLSFRWLFPPEPSVRFTPMDSGFSQGWSATGHILKPKVVSSNRSSMVLSADFGDNQVIPIEEISCTICLSDYQHGDRIQRNALNEESRVCDHIFHPECITEWIEKSNSSECPCCRSPFSVWTMSSGLIFLHGISLPCFHRHSSASRRIRGIDFLMFQAAFGLRQVLHKFNFTNHQRLRCDGWLMRYIRRWKK